MQISAVKKAKTNDMLIRAAKYTLRVTKFTDKSEIGLFSTCGLHESKSNAPGKPIYCFILFFHYKEGIATQLYTHFTTSKIGRKSKTCF